MSRDLDWDRTILGLPSPHLLQTSEWAEFKNKYGWQALQKTWTDQVGNVTAAAMILKRTMRLTPLGPQVAVLYSPRGPLVDWSNPTRVDDVLRGLEAFARKEKAIFLKIDGEIPLGEGIPSEEGSRENPIGKAVLDLLSKRGWRYSPEQIQFKNTMWLDLTGEEDDWLKRMKQKTRYNLRLAQRSGVVVREAGQAELPLLYRMYAETSVRDGFVIRGQEYYLDAWDQFMQSGMAYPLIAEVEGAPVAGLILFVFGKRAWYLYGMSTQNHREKMPNYLLQWEAMRKAKALGCEIYDLWGAPDEFSVEDRMFGVFRFKEGLGAKVVRSAGAWDYVAKPFFYYLYMRVLPAILNVMRRNRKAQTRQEVL